jgi:shikimate kinase
MNKGNNNIFITGFMGSGKSTIGKALAKKLNKKYYDLDQSIEEFLEKKIPAVIEEFGLEYFRKIENQQLAVVCKMADSVISLGGGTLIAEKNQRQVGKSGILVFLMAEEKTLMQRLEKSHARPLLMKKGFCELFEERKWGYMKSDLCIRTDEFSPEVIVDRIVSEIVG